MVLSYTVIGAMLAENIFWDRVLAIVLIYFLGLGVAAHALDAIGGEAAKPWGQHFSKRGLWILAVSALIPAYGIGIYYILFWTPLLLLIAILEGFFLFAYNLEWFNGRFHTDGWFAFSWGVLPVLAGYIIQTNNISIASLTVAAAMGLVSLVEINASRPYKEIKRSNQASALPHLKRYEMVLKGVSMAMLLLGTGMVLWRWGL
jgi:xanthine/uracil permease